MDGRNPFAPPFRNPGMMFFFPVNCSEQWLQPWFPSGAKWISQPSTESQMGAINSFSPFATLHRDMESLPSSQEHVVIFPGWFFKGNRSLLEICFFPVDLRQMVSITGPSVSCWLPRALRRPWTSSVWRACSRRWRPRNGFLRGSLGMGFGRSECPLLLEAPKRVKQKKPVKPGICVGVSFSAAWNSFLVSKARELDHGQSALFCTEYWDESKPKVDCGFAVEFPPGKNTRAP